MIPLEDIKNEFAVMKGYKDWDHLYSSIPFIVLNQFWEEICKSIILGKVIFKT